MVRYNAYVLQRTPEAFSSASLAAFRKKTMKSWRLIRLPDHTKPGVSKRKEPVPEPQSVVNESKMSKQAGPKGKQNDVKARKRTEESTPILECAPSRDKASKMARKRKGTGEAVLDRARLRKERWHKMSSPELSDST